MNVLACLLHALASKCVHFVKKNINLVPNFFLLISQANNIVVLITFHRFTISIAEYLEPRGGMFRPFMQMYLTEIFRPEPCLWVAWPPSIQSLSHPCIATQITTAIGQ